VLERGDMKSSAHCWIRIRAPTIVPISVPSPGPSPPPNSSHTRAPACPEKMATTPKHSCCVPCWGVARSILTPRMVVSPPYGHRGG